MDLYEYQAKELFAAHGVPTQLGTVARTVDEAVDAADRARPAGDGEVAGEDRRSG